MDLRKVEAFLCAAEQANLSEAARLLHLSQPAVSHQIKSLESELGVRLFARTNTGLTLTEAGQMLVPWARHILHETQDMKDMMASLDDLVVGQVLIACSASSGKYILPHLAARFCKNYPGVNVSISACGPNHAITSLLDGKAHLGIASTEINDPALESQFFFRDNISLIVPACHPWAERESVEIADILQETLILREETSGTRRIMMAELARFDISQDDLNVFMEVGSAEGIVELVAEGYGISFVADLVSRNSLLLGKIKRVKVEGVTMRRAAFMVRKRISPPHRPRDVFWSFIHAPENSDLIVRGPN
jgi:DNA-binding transcriptional LysR family regulator